MQDPKESSLDENQYCSQNQRLNSKALLIYLALMSYSYRLPEITHLKNSGTVGNSQLYQAGNSQILFLCIKPLKSSSVFAKNNHLSDSSSCTSCGVIPQ